MKKSLASIVMIVPVLLGADSAEIRSLLENRIDLGKKAVGIVVGTIDEKGRAVIGYGKLAKDRDEQPDGDTVFEIGSITKVFTSLILADMVERGEVKLDDPVSKFLPASVTVPSRNGRQITLLDLSMQISGLPRLPTNMKPADPANPYVDYDAAKLYEFLSGYKLQRDIGEKYEYSNLGVGLLGHALSLKAGMSYEQLVKKRILEPLGMTSSSVTLSNRRRNGWHRSRRRLSPVKNWDLDALAGAGALRSTANDMLKFLAANLELTDSPLKPRCAACGPCIGKPECRISKSQWPGTCSTNSAPIFSGTTAEQPGIGHSQASIQLRKPAWWFCATPFSTWTKWPFTS